MTIVTASLLTNIATPTAVVDSVTVTPSVAMIAGTTTATDTIPTDGFSTALNQQINLLVKPTTNTTLMPTLSTLLATTTVTAAGNNVTTTLQQDMMATPSTDTTSIPTVATTVTTDSSIPTNSTNEFIPTNSTMSAADTAILSNVADTLKFIVSGSKLVDTLPAGQTVQLPAANLGASLSQQLVQTALQQAVTATQVNIPAIIPSSTLLDQAVVSQVVNSQTAVFQSSSQNGIVSTVPLSVTSQIEDIQPTATTQTANTNSIVAAQVQIPSTFSLNNIQPVFTDTVIQTPVTLPNVTDEKIQTSVNLSAVTYGQVQPPVSLQVNNSQSVVTTQVQSSVNLQEINYNSPLTNAQSVVTALRETPVVSQLIMSQTITTTMTQQTSVSEQPSLIPMDVVDQMTTPMLSMENATPLPATLQQTTIKIEKKLASQTENLTSTESLLLTNPIMQAVPQNIITDNKNNNTAQNLTSSDIQQTNTQNSSLVSTQADPSINLVAVIVPTIAVQSDPQKITADTTTNTVKLEDKVATLTSAKNLLMDAVANRSMTNGDSSNNSNSNNPASNPMQQGELLSTTSLDAKQSITDKPFSSLLANETDTTNSGTPPSSDKITSQVAMSAVHKLVQDIKIDVPAMTRPLTHPSWNQELGSRILWMNNQGASSAEIKMNPQNMGPITVKIDMNHDQANISFTAQNSDVRNALEASIPKLREMLSSQNVSLAEVNVSQQSSSSMSSDSSRSQQQAAQMAADASANGQGNRQNNPEVVDAQGNPIAQTNLSGDMINLDQMSNVQVLNDNGTNGLLSIFA